MGGGFPLAAQIMAERGIVTLRIDFMGSGDSEASYTDYNYTSANLDAKAAADYLAALDFVDPEKISVLGWSQGGTNALLAASAYPTTFKAVVTWSAALDLTALFPNFTMAYARAQVKGYYEQPPLSIGRRWFDEVFHTNLPAVLYRLTVPVLAIGGSRDAVVSQATSRYIAQIVPNGTSYIIDGATHVYGTSGSDPEVFYQAVDLSIDFLLEKLAGTAN